ncbi:MAG TPA: 1-(5-phosphoribosyl)-5-[(5-phosphoribosylamino)methylideneamino]imidazole-4-carboxamide isomerase [Candidatus Bathyarchaeia archaeon]|nr:1-(5-phosphoribosyl)-5-[(5-phosphoribosylamino)methylideneamino]imidazole-4-carboxamide isomerase [Candidatus Bathyarchaeia archaeon]
MILIPAVDISKGECVRFIQGDPKKRLVYFNDPVEVAVHWQKDGAKYLHVVDLDSALELGENRSVIRKILDEVSIPVQVGGGVRSVEEAQKILSWGATRVIFGTAVISDPFAVKEAIEKLGRNKVMVAIDERGGKVAIRGWKEATTADPYRLAWEMENLGIGTLLYSSVEQDGLMQGPNVKNIERMVRSVQIPVIAAGGVSRVGDVVAVKRTGAAGLILGRALYEMTFTLREALMEVSRR